MQHIWLRADLVAQWRTKCMKYEVPSQGSMPHHILCSCEDLPFGVYEIGSVFKANLSTGFWENKLLHFKYYFFNVLMLQQWCDEAQAAAAVTIYSVNNRM